MKKLLTIFTSFLVLALFSATASASSISSAQTGNWNTTTTWTGGIVPGSGDDVTIAAGNTVTLDVSPTVNSCTVARNWDS
jgi:spermidine/putrescine-binding protein